LTGRTQQETAVRNAASIFSFLKNRKRAQG